MLDEPTTRHGKVTFKSGDKEIDGYLARPKAEGKVPAVLVIAGNRITEEYIPNTCAALAVAGGDVGLAPNIDPVPDSARTPDEITKSLEGWTDADFLRDIRSGAAYLEGHEAVRAGAWGSSASVPAAGVLCYTPTASKTSGRWFPTTLGRRRPRRSPG